MLGFFFWGLIEACLILKVLGSGLCLRVMAVLMEMLLALPFVVAAPSLYSMFSGWGKNF